MGKFFKTLIPPSLFLGLLFSILVIGCKSEFEQVRTSGDPERIYDKAMEFYEKEDYSKAISLMEIILSSYRGTSQGEDLYFKYAYANYYQKDRKSTRLNSSHVASSYAVFCLKKKTRRREATRRNTRC